jgi:hypothetical protein
LHKRHWNQIKPSVWQCSATLGEEWAANGVLENILRDKIKPKHIRS